MLLLLGLVDEHDVGVGTVAIRPHPYWTSRLEQYLSGPIDELVARGIRVNVAVMDTPRVDSTPQRRLAERLQITR
jgi:hypothetical protein